MSLDSVLDPLYEKVDAENKMLMGWYGDVFTPVKVRWNEITSITQYRLVHAHDLDTNKCMKNRAGLRCP